MTSNNAEIICRACLCDEQELLKSFVDNPSIMKIYSSCTLLQVDVNDGLPINLCTICIQKCTDWYSFKQLCTNNESILKNRLNEPATTELSSNKDTSIISNIDIDVTVKNEMYIDELSQSSDNISHSSDELNTNDDKDYLIENHKDPDESIKTNNTNYEYAECGDKLKINKRQRNLITKFECSECGKIFPTRAKRSIHMPSHTGEKPFKCNICDKLFSTKDYVRIHMRNHTGEKPFLCTLCGKSFRQKSSLNTHYLTHTDKKPYACSRCDKSYKTKSYLTLHMKCHKI